MSTTLQPMLNGRYEIREVLGRGAMGVIYSAFDTILHREVAIKTIRDFHNAAAFQMFRKECSVLASLAHPNIVPIFDAGEIQAGDGRRPYFIMPLLRGVTLDAMIRGPEPMTVNRAAEIIVQTCRGLQAAHDRNLVHRDLKPSNIFVELDGSVKIIDFGVAHLMDHHTTLGIKGTLTYMAPEMILMKGATPRSDIFSIAVVCFETLTGRLPFPGPTENEIVQGILYHNPPLICEINPGVNRATSQVIHKAMAKQPQHRFASVSEFADNLVRAIRSESIECLEPARVLPRVQTAQRALDSGELDFAAEIVSELEAEGHLHPELHGLRTRLDRALRERTIYGLLSSAHRRLQEQEFQLALNKIEEILRLEPSNVEAAAMKTSIERQIGKSQVQDWLMEAHQQLDQGAFDQARTALRGALQVRPNDTQVRELMMEVDRRQHEAAQPPPVAFEPFPIGETIVQPPIPHPPPRRGLWVALGIAGLLAAGGAGGFWYWQSQQKPVTASVPAKPARPIEPMKTPEPPKTAIPALKITTDLDSAAVALDGTPAAEASGGQWVVQSLSSGAHTVLVTGKFGVRASLQFSAESGALPELIGPIGAQNVKALVVGNAGTSLRIWAQFAASDKIAVSLDGKDPIAVPSTNVDITGLSLGAHTLTVVYGRQRRDMPIEVGAPSAVSMLLTTERNVGGLVIAGASGAQLLIDDKEAKSIEQRGELVLQNVEAKAHLIRVTKNGFRADPQEQNVVIKKGEITRLTFALIPIATLSIRGGIPGTDLALDGKPLGQVGLAGTFSAQVDAGSHTIALSHRGYRAATLTRTFGQGEIVILTGGDVILAKVPSAGTVNIAVTPSNISGLRITMRRQDGSEQVVSGQTDLAEGEYTLRATASGYADFLKPGIRVKAGETQTIAVAMQASDAGKGGTDAGPLAGWDNPSGWTAWDNWFVHKGLDAMLYRVMPPGTHYVFSSKGKALRFFVNYRDAKNYVRYDADKSAISRVQVVNGQETGQIKSQHNVKIRDSVYTATVGVNGQSVVVSLQDGSQWKVVDEFRSEQDNFAAGKFGLAAGKGVNELYMSQFKTY